jgi:hypothetical protein
MEIDLEHLYAVLAPVARRQGQMTYGALSQNYYRRTQDWHEPHGSWDRPLGKLNRMLHPVGWPPLSAVVVLKQDDPEPGGRFWESSPDIPTRPADDVARMALYGRLLRAVHEAPWPHTIPTAPPP